jgi:hypothetical protein
MDTHTFAFLLSTGRDEIVLESVPNKDMSVVVCVHLSSMFTLKGKRSSNGVELGGLAHLLSELTTTSIG